MPTPERARDPQRAKKIDPRAKSAHNRRANRLREAAELRAFELAEELAETKAKLEQAREELLDYNDPSRRQP